MHIETENGIINISNETVAAVAGNAASNCFGVKGMTVTSMKDGLVRLLKREAMTKGVRVIETPQGEMIVELHIAVDHGLNIIAAGSSIINEVRYQVETVTGIQVTAVNVYVDTIKV